MLTLVATLGYQQGLLRFIGSYLALKERGLVCAVIRYAERRVTLAGVGIATFATATVFVLANQIQTNLAHTFFVGFAIVPPLALLRVRASVVRGFGGVFSALVPDMVMREAVTILFVGGAAAVLSTAVTAPIAMGAVLAGSCMGMLLVSVSQYYRDALKWKTAPIEEHRSEWNRSAIILLVLSGTQLALRQAEVILLGWLVDTTTAGFYAVTLRVANLVTFPLLATNIVFLPAIAALYATNDHTGLQHQFANWVKWSTISATIIALPLFLFAELILSLFGAPFGAAGPALRIVLVGQLVNGSIGSVGFVLIMTGHERLAATIVAVFAPCSLIFLVLLIFAFGLEGAAIARASTLIGINIINAIYVWRRLKIGPGLFVAKQ
jgi:O-antigen/teichoic acid export membrane protein